MKIKYVLLGFAFLMLALASHAENPVSAKPSFLGERPWTKPGWVKVRATAYPKDALTKSGIKQSFATKNSVGTAAVPYWIHKGSVIRIWTANGIFVYLAADQGRAVESRKAAKEMGKIKKQKNLQKLPVIDFCAPKQYWPDFINVEIFQYTGTTSFEKLTFWQKQQVIVYARKFIQRDYKAQ